MPDMKGFWSYVHADDEADGGRISRLARDVVSQFEMLTGEALGLFLDRDAIEWGEEWRDKIDASLASVAFFIPVMTPCYFMSAECRREFQFFARQATRLGIKELILPLLYVDVPGLRDDTPTDDIMALVRTFQWEDWRDLRFAAVDAEGYRRGVSRLAARIVDANRRVEKADVAKAVSQLQQTATGSGQDDSPGFIDQIATAEDALPKLVETVEAIGGDIVLIGQAMQEAAADIERGNRQAKPFVTRLLIAQKVARRLAEPAERIWSSANTFATQLHDVDQGIRVIIESAAQEVENNPEAKDAACEFFKAVRSLSANANVGLGSAQQMIDAIAPIEKMSRDLRPVLRRLRQGLTTMLEGREVSDEWVRLIEKSPVKCDDDDTPPEAS